MTAALVGTNHSSREPMRRMTKTGGGDAKFPGADQLKSDCVFIFIWAYSVMSDSLQPHGLCSPPGSSVHGILQARMLDWVAMSFSRGSSPLRDWTQVSCIEGKFFITWATRKALRNREWSNVGCDEREDWNRDGGFLGLSFSKNERYAGSLPVLRLFVDKMKKCQTVLKILF